MGIRKFKNNAIALLVTGVNNTTDFQFTVTAGKGDLFPDTTAGDWFKVTLEDSSGNVEVWKITTRTAGSDVFSAGSAANRAQDGTIKRAFIAGDICELRLLAADIENAVVVSDLQGQSFTAGVTSGSSTAYTLTPVVPITSYVENQEFDVEFHTASGAAPTINISGLGAKNLKYRDSAGALKAVTASVFPTGWRSNVVYDGTDMIVREIPVGNIGQNAIIGGDFSTNPWQIGTSFAAIATAAYHADMFNVTYVTAGVVTVSKSTDAPTAAQAGRLATHCLLVDCTTADASIAAGDIFRVSQAVEGCNFMPLAQGAMKLKFWHKHTKTGTYCVAFRNSGLDRSYVAEYTQAVTDTWELAEITITASPSAGTWDYTSGVGLWVDFTILSGSTFQTTANAWQTGNFSATSSQVNGLDSTANNFRIALVELVPGNGSALPRTEQEERALCQKYYYRLTPGAVSEIFGAAYATATTTFQAHGDFPVTMRTEPTALEQSGTANQYAVLQGSQTIQCSAVATFSTATTKNAWVVNGTVASGFTDGFAGVFRTDGTNGAAAYLGWSARL